MTTKIIHFYFALFLFSNSSCTSFKKQRNYFSKNVDSSYYKTNDLDKLNPKIDFHILLKSPPPKELIIESIYFNNQKTKVVSVDETHLLGVFSKKTLKKDYSLSSDVKQEYGNSPPFVTFRDILAPDEAAIEYKVGTKTYYYRITSVQKK